MVDTNSDLFLSLIESFFSRIVPCYRAMLVPADFFSVVHSRPFLLRPTLHPTPTPPPTMKGAFPPSAPVLCLFSHTVSACGKWCCAILPVCLATIRAPLGGLLALPCTLPSKQRRAPVSLSPSLPPTHHLWCNSPLPLGWKTFAQHGWGRAKREPSQLAFSQFCILNLSWALPLVLCFRPSGNQWPSVASMCFHVQYCLR